MSLPNFAFEKIFSRLLIYNMLFEDSEVDCRYVALKDSDRVLSIAGAGCGVAGLVSFNPRSIDVVDRNLPHLSLSAIKMLAPRHLEYEDFYRLLGHGKHERSRELLSAITRAPHVPEKIRSYWRKNDRIFAKGLYSSGLTANVLQRMTRLARIDEAWLDEVAGLPMDERVAKVQQDVCLKLDRRVFRTMFAAPVQMLSHGINFRQKQRIEQESQLSIHDHTLAFLRNIVTTEVHRNWFIWVPLLGKFNHRDSLAVPPYLRKEFHAKSAESRTDMRWHHRNIFDSLRDQKDDYWTYVNCSDALDWMDAKRQRRMLDLISKKAKPGATVLLRSVERQDLVSRHGMQRRFERVHDVSDRASGEERSRLYRQVAFYRLAK